MPPPAALLVFVVGAGSLGAEIAAARLLAPYFGASTIVWANTIGVVLVALSIGYWLGGRLADRHPHMRGLCLLALSAAVLLALVPFVGRPAPATSSVDALDAISAGAFVGSLFGVLALVAVPVLLLGAVSPWAIRLARAARRGLGHAWPGGCTRSPPSARWSGTLISALLLIPLVGTRRTFLVFALALARGRGARAAAGAALRARAGRDRRADRASRSARSRPRPSDGRVIYEAETQYQYARVVERPGRRRRSS